MDETLTEDTLPEAALTLVEDIARLLVGKRYAQLIEMATLSRLTEEELESGIRDYGATLSNPADAQYRDRIDAIEGESTPAAQWSVRVGLWTKEEGESDLTLGLTVRQTGAEDFDYDIDDLRVR